MILKKNYDHYLQTVCGHTSFHPRQNPNLHSPNHHDINLHNRLQIKYLLEQLLHKTQWEHTHYHSHNNNHIRTEK